MKTVKSLIISSLLAVAAPSFAIVSPFYGSTEIIKGIMNDSRVISSLGKYTAESISSIRQTKDGYAISAGDCRLNIRVEVVVDPAAVGSFKFTLLPDQVFCLGGADLPTLDSEIAGVIDTSCSSTSECASAGYYKRPCGGFSNYLIYSTSTTDVNYLKNLLDLHYKLDKAEGISICSIEMPPQLDCVANKCIQVSK